MGKLREAVVALSEGGGLAGDGFGGVTGDFQTVECCAQLFRYGEAADKFAEPRNRGQAEQWCRAGGEDVPGDAEECECYWSTRNLFALKWERS